LKHIKTKILTVTLILSLSILLFKIAYAQNALGQNCQVVFPSTSSLGFQNDIDKTVTLEITNGILNSTTNNLKIYDGGGHFRFTALNNTQIKIDYTVTAVKVSGDQNHENRVVTSGSTITVNAGDNVLISWDITLEPWLPVMFIIGMVGLASTIGGPVYVYHKIKEGKYYEGFRNGLVVTVIGVAFVLAWLW